MPVTTPVLLTVAVPVALLLHIPPVAASVSVVVALSHTVAAPDIVPATGSGVTVTTKVTVNRNESTNSNSNSSSDHCNEKSYDNSNGNCSDNINNMTTIETVTTRQQ